MKECDLGSLPPGWARRALADLADVKMGQSPPSEAYNREGVGLPFFQGKADFSDFYASPRVWCAAAGKTAEADDILLSVRAPVGPTNLAPAKCVIGRGLAAICPVRPFHCKYFIYAFRRFASDLARLGTGTTFQAVSGKQVRAMEFPIAPLAEQLRIVAKIEELFSDLDAGVAALERVKANLKRYRAAVLKAAVEGNLTAEWRKKNPAAETGGQLLKRILAERQRKWEEEQLKKFAEKGKAPPKGWREKYQVPESPDVAGLAALPEGWCWASIRQVADVGTGTTPSRSNPRFYEGGKIPWLTSTVVNEAMVRNATEFVTPEAVAAGRLRLYPAGTLLVALYGEGKTRGKVTEITFAATVNQAIGALVFADGIGGLKGYVKLFLMSAYARMRGSSTGGVQPNLNLGLLSSVCLAVPSIPEQRQIVAEVERRLSVADAVAAQVERSLKRAARLRQAILKRAFEGKLVAQNAADEPASVLLERIKAQRAVVPERLREGQKRVGTPALVRWRAC